MAGRPRFDSFETPQRNFYDKLMAHQAGGDWGAPKPRPQDFSSDSAELRIMEELLKRLFGGQGGALPQPEAPANVREGGAALDQDWVKRL